MYNDVAEAIENQDYQSAQELLQQIGKEDSDNPWFQFYIARLDEARANLAQAHQQYRQLLLSSPNPKIVALARQGINRISELEDRELQIAKAQRQEILAKLNSEPGNTEPGILILEPIPNELKQKAALAFAKIMNLDPYSARLQLPSRVWRLYRTGNIGEMRYYQELLTKAEIPCFSASLPEIKRFQVYEIKYLDSVSPQVTAVYKPKKGESETITFDWSMVTQRVEGRLPIFEECIDIDAKRQLQRKTKTLDYIQVCDLHLKANWGAERVPHSCIIRLWDQNYEFQKGVNFSSAQHTGEPKTTSDNWKQLNQYLNQQLPQVPVWSDFNHFAETALDFQEMLKLIEPHITLLRPEETPWDAAFELYSRLVFIHE
ncbi:tetratricopeptide repeat protein [Gloeothece verrucosa]|uniref:Cyclic nucleotide-binding protein n=1 Tax=Gloeothece verrucosa (strain PCC 7822) TaxID=497965 RepID=E0UAZ2_GLOV7|nr:tetratricopeptide repeat protein [Gloeothece verrucosa]ADN15114.1 conserved hypothetical protein [Gloeothece verrucosa PCC 7822]